MPTPPPPKRRGGRPRKDPGGKLARSESSMRNFNFRVPADLEREIIAAYESGESGARSMSEMFRLILQQWVETPDRIIVTRELATDIRALKRPVMAMVLERMSQVFDDELPAMLKAHWERGDYDLDPRD